VFPAGYQQTAANPQTEVGNSNAALPFCLWYAASGLWPGVDGGILRLDLLGALRHQSPLGQQRFPAVVGLSGDRHILTRGNVVLLICV